jgi:hypothetical protein
MSFFGSLFGKRRAPDPPEADPLYELLFGDVPTDEGRDDKPAHSFPDTAFAAARDRTAAGDVAGAVRAWREVADRPDLESRHVLRAWALLRAHGAAPPPDVAKRTLGVVIEAALPEGLDVVAAYADHTARYFNHSGKRIFWDARGPLDAAIDDLLAAAQAVVDVIGPWDGPRRPPPSKGNVRLSFLTPSGLHFGEGKFKAIESDGLSGPVFHRGVALMQALIARTGPKGPR